jgi:hypothetical protein
VNYEDSTLTHKDMINIFISTWKVAKNRIVLFMHLELTSYHIFGAHKYNFCELILFMLWRGIMPSSSRLIKPGRAGSMAPSELGQDSLQDESSLDGEENSEK